MKRFIKRVAVFLFPILVLLAVLEILERRVPNDYTVKRQQLEQRLEEIEVLIVGSSHPFLGLNPALFDAPTYNLGMTAQTHYYDRHLVEMYIDRMPRLETLVLSVSYASIGIESAGLPAMYDHRHIYALFWGSREPLGLPGLLDLRTHSQVAYYSVKVAIERLLEFRAGKPMVVFQPNGWYATDEQHDLERNGRDTGTYHDRYFDDAVVPKNVAALEAAVELAKARGVSVVLLSPPMWKSYMQHVTPARYQLMVSAMNELSREQDVPYVDFTNDPRFVEEDFYDANHLRTGGAAKFSAMVNQIVVKERARSREG